MAIADDLEAVKGQHQEAMEYPIQVEPSPLGAPPPYSPMADNTAQGDVPKPKVIVVNQHTGTFVWGHEPTPTRCKFCRKEVLTTVKSDWRCEKCCQTILCFVFRAVDCGCNVTEHSCPECHCVLGASK